MSTDILDDEMIKTINPVSPKDLQSICMYIQQTLDIRDHPAVNRSQ
jgi:sorbitol-specific phosphotransferase system component IIA